MASEIRVALLSLFIVLSPAAAQQSDRCARVIEQASGHAATKEEVAGAGLAANAVLESSRMLILTRHNGEPVEFEATDGTTRWSGKSLPELTSKLLQATSTPTLLLRFGAGFSADDREAFVLSLRLQESARRTFVVEDGASVLLFALQGDLTLVRVIEPQQLLSGEFAGWWQSVVTFATASRSTFVRILARTKEATQLMVASLRDWTAGLSTAHAPRTFVEAVFSSRRRVAERLGIPESDVKVLYRTELGKMQIVELPEAVKEQACVAV